MKKLIFLLTLLVGMLGLDVYAQSMLNQTYINPISFSTQSNDVDLSLYNGDRFVGKKQVSYINGSVNTVSYFGTLHKANGEKFVTASAGMGLTENFGVPRNVTGYIWYIKTDGTTIRQKYQNGQCVSQEYEEKSYSFNNNCITFPTTPSYSSGYYGGYSSGGSSYDSNSGGSSYDRHKATCGGCSGTGKCSLCNGRGYNDRGYKCSRCNGNGICNTCHGNGFIRGNF